LGLDSVLSSSLFGTVEGVGVVAAELEGGEDGGGMVVASLMVVLVSDER
jgi:hypothetical protein